MQEVFNFRVFLLLHDISKKRSMNLSKLREYNKPVFCMWVCKRPCKNVQIT